MLKGSGGLAETVRNNEMRAESSHSQGGYAVKSLHVLLLGAVLIGITSPALAAAPRTPLSAGGRTIAGPGNITVAKTQTETLMSNFWASDACVTVVNAGAVDLTLNTIGAGQHSIVVVPLDSVALCEESLTTVTLSCTGTQAGDCRVTWRVDR